MDQSEVLVSYNKIYEIEQKVYSIGNFRLPQPVQLHTAAATIISVVLILVLDSILHLFFIPGIIKFLILPYFIGKKVTVSRKDGKNLYRYYCAYIPYILSKHITIERFKECEDIKQIQFFK